MPQVTFRLPDGTEHDVVCDSGTSIMRAAVQSGVPGIVGECGGSALCCTCHVYLDEFIGSQSEINPVENEMLECTASPRKPSSRLGCQVVLGSDNDGATIIVPEAQY
ncbi:2Fe-2S iron-sulfur cluster-binding protein [Novosphingobium resinovorum]|uniref:Ferredoxin n=1 Tax=Novosphingobium resinovorum TaxID=158500 RepID=A0A1D8A6P9_9SPHN|nr:2Fe-2S iron-sulfur cluster-binding protein [Novosphingobium resinovorum]AOR77775.1 ferredoxin [Novosphingobium resinovorum]